MDRLCKNLVPSIPPNLFDSVEKELKIVHINVRNVLTKLIDIRNEDVFQQADIICLNETHMSQNDELICEMMNITENCVIFLKRQEQKWWWSCSYSEQ